MAVEVLIAVLVALLALVTLVAAYVGILGVFGGLRLSRCRQCNHLGITSIHDPNAGCTYCRHDRLLHPVAALHHVHR